MEFEELQKNWEEFGKTNPLGAISMDPEITLHKFFKNGKNEIKEVMGHVKSLDIDFPCNMALDFGCGAGRLTHALSKYFEEVWGVDISSSMLEKAKEYGWIEDNCKYILNKTDDLSLFADNSFDFIYSSLTLQHMKPQYSKKYIKEFLRILNPQGLAVVQVSSHELHPLNTHEHKLHKRLEHLVRYITPRKITDQFYKARAKLLGVPLMEMYGVKQQDVVDLIENTRANIIDIQQDNHATGWIGFKYYITK